MLAVLESKYKKKFIPIRIEPRGFQIDYDKLLIYPEVSNEDTDKAHIAMLYEEKGKIKNIDNYFNIHIRDEFEEIDK